LLHDNASPSQYVFKVVGNRFVLPKELVGKVKSVTVWDLRGRWLGKVEVGDGDLLLKMPRNLIGKGMFIVKSNIDK
jgi:hypothetical protein